MGPANWLEFGQPIDASNRAWAQAPATKAFPDLLKWDADLGWVDQHGKYMERHGTIATIEMGARRYVPLLGTAES